MSIIDIIKDFLANPVFWVVLACISVAIYGIAGRLSYIGVFGVIKNYKGVFVKNTDFVFFIILPLFLAIASILYKDINSGLSDLMSVVLSILTSMVLTFMAMTNDKYENNIHKTDKGEDELHLAERNKDALAVGMYEILISILVLILIFTLPIFSAYNNVALVMGTFIYYGFYSFLLNVFIMVRRLFQIYFK